MVADGDAAGGNGRPLMLVYLDSVICIYAVEGAPSFQARARARLAALRAAGDNPAISDLTWLECRVKLIRLGDAAALVRDCPCAAGCPSCIGPLHLVEGAKEACLKLLSASALPV